MVETMRFALDRLPTDPVLLQKMLLEMADVMEQVPSAELEASDIDMFRQYGDIYKHMAFGVRVDDAGVEMNLSLELD